MVDLEPGKWYQFPRLFGEQIAVLDPQRILRPPPDCDSYTFRQLSAGFDRFDFAFEMTQSRVDKLNPHFYKSMPVYYLFGKPDISKVIEEGENSMKQLIQKTHVEILVAVGNVDGIDLRENGETPSGYDCRFAFFIRSPNGTYFSKGHVVPDGEKRKGVTFAFWTPIDGDKRGSLLFPPTRQELTRLELMVRDI